jgi:hypothetical protein
MRLERCGSSVVIHKKFGNGSTNPLTSILSKPSPASLSAGVAGPASDSEDESSEEEEGRLETTEAIEGESIGVWEEDFDVEVDDE